MSLPHLPKRRRLDTALHKPFRSPLKNPLLSPHPTTLPTPPPSDPGPLNENTSFANPPAISSPTTKQLTATPTATLSTTTPSTDLPLPPPSSTSPSLHTLQSHATHLQTTLLNRKARLETSTQALAIELNPAREASLTLLVEKWRKASRAAAEEVFAGARDKVNRMGGVKGMREREREGRRWRGEWEAENREGGGGGEEDGGAGGEDGDGVGDREERAERDERDERVEEGEEEEEEVDEEGGYTMDMMLKSMGIELGVIGFDKELQRWVD